MRSFKQYFFSCLIMNKFDDELDREHFLRMQKDFQKYRVRGY